MPRGTQVPLLQDICFSLTGVSPSLPLFPAGSVKQIFCNLQHNLQIVFKRSYYPDVTTAAAFNVDIGLGSSPFARHYLGNRSLFLFLRVLRCFTSPGALCPAYLIQPGVTGHYPSRVPPFGDLRIIAYLRLPEAFRSLSRPSSAPGAKAFALRSF